MVLLCWEHAYHSRREREVQGTCVYIVDPGGVRVTPWRYVLRATQNGDGMCNEEKEDFVRNDPDAEEVADRRATCVGCRRKISIVSSLYARESDFNLNAWLAHKLLCENMQCVF